MWPGLGGEKVMTGQKMVPAIKSIKVVLSEQQGEWGEPYMILYE